MTRPPFPLTAIARAVRACVKTWHDPRRLAEYLAALDRHRAAQAKTR